MQKSAYKPHTPHDKINKLQTNTKCENNIKCENRERQPQPLSPKVILSSADQLITLMRGNQILAFLFFYFCLCQQKQCIHGTVRPSYHLPYFYFICTSISTSGLGLKTFLPVSCLTCFCCLLKVQASAVSFEKTFSQVKRRDCLIFALLCSSGLTFSVSKSCPSGAYPPK